MSQPSKEFVKFGHDRFFFKRDSKSLFKIKYKLDSNSKNDKVLQKSNAGILGSEPTTKTSVNVP